MLAAGFVDHGLAGFGGAGSVWLDDDGGVDEYGAVSDSDTWSLMCVESTAREGCWPDFVARLRLAPGDVDPVRSQPEMEAASLLWHTAAAKGLGQRLHVELP